MDIFDADSSYIRLDNIIINKEELKEYYEILKRDFTNNIDTTIQDNIQPLLTKEEELAEIDRPLIQYPLWPIARCINTRTSWPVWPIVGAEIYNKVIDRNENLLFGIIKRLHEKLPWIKALVIAEFPPNSEFGFNIDRGMDGISFIIPIKLSLDYSWITGKNIIDISIPNSDIKKSFVTQDLLPEIGKMYLLNTRLPHKEINKSSTETQVILWGQIYSGKAEDTKNLNIII